MTSCGWFEGCSQDADPRDDAGLCYYHKKLGDGLLEKARVPRASARSGVRSLVADEPDEELSG